MGDQTETRDRVKSWDCPWTKHQHVATDYQETEEEKRICQDKICTNTRNVKVGREGVLWSKGRVQLVSGTFICLAFLLALLHHNSFVRAHELQFICHSKCLFLLRFMFSPVFFCCCFTNICQLWKKGFHAICCHLLSSNPPMSGLPRACPTW